MRIPNNAEIKSSVTRRAARFGQKGDRPIRGALIDFVHGKRSESYLRVPFYEVDEIVPIHGSSGELLDIAGDPDATSLMDYVQRFRKRAAILATGRAALEHALKNTGGRAAIAVTVGDVLLAGVFPEGTKDLGRTTRWEYTAGLSKGRDDFRANLGSFDGHTFAVPAGAFILDNDVAIADFRERAKRGTPLV